MIKERTDFSRRNSVRRQVAPEKHLNSRQHFHLARDESKNQREESVRVKARHEEWRAKGLEYQGV